MEFQKNLVLKSNKYTYSFYTLAFLVLTQSALFSQMINLVGGDSSRKCKIEIANIVLQNSIHNKMVYGADGEFTRNNSFFTGLALRVHSKKTAMRISVLGYEESYDFDPSNTFNNSPSGLFDEPVFMFDPQFLNSVLRKTVEAKLGLQAAIFNARLSSYVFGDIGYRYVNESRFYTYTTISQNVETIHNVLEHAKAQFIALHTGVGLRYQFTSHFYGAYECSAVGGYLMRESDRKGRFADAMPMINYIPAQFMFGIYF